ncbi:MAG: TIGR00159 family protein [Anaerolineae bacterium]|nr:TIGR00159 family protein [Anaerolineae bacterium]
MQFLWALESITWLDVLDILTVTLILYGASFIIRGTTSVTAVRGLIVALIITILVSSLFQLAALQWLTGVILTLLGVSIAVIFAPELRRALERLGRAGQLKSRAGAEDSRTIIIEQVAQASERLSERRHGALIVLERTTGLGEYVRTGVRLNADVSPQLLLTIFWPKTELHDGAVIISDGRITAAAAVLPLSAARTLSGPKLGTRHRAAIGISEASDAVTVVVSEETGRISVASGGRLISRLDGKRLRTILSAMYGPQPGDELPWHQRLRQLLPARAHTASRGS